MRIVENLRKHLGKNPETWSLKREWNDVYKEFYSTKSARSLSQVRKLFDCYKSIRKETNQESEGLRQRQEHGGANTT